MVIEAVELSIRHLLASRESLKKAEVTLHSDLAKYVKLTLGKKVDVMLTGSGWTDILVNATTTGMLLLARAKPNDPNLNRFAKSARGIIEEVETNERQVAKVARARESEIDELSTTELFQLLERLTTEPVQVVLNSDWIENPKSSPVNHDPRN
ncbi:MAG: hypothetical protein O6846_05525 [Thaumarchaeota archaeon]|nr:hypothetical protein [Nitrososphaerota archaeon]